MGSSVVVVVVVVEAVVVDVVWSVCRSFRLKLGPVGKMYETP